MKNLYLLSILFLCTLGMFAQTPQKMNYQTVVRNSSNMILANQSVGIQISILQGSTLGTAVYVETQTPTTNANGLASIEIGTGSIVSGDFSTIDWANNTYFIKTEIDPTGGTNYTITGTSQLASVPYALHAKTAESVSGTVNYTETDPVYSASPANNITTADITTLSNTSGTNTGDQDISGIATNATDISTLQTEQTTQNTAIALNTAKTGITAQQASDITANNAKVTDANHVISSTTDDLTEGTTNLYYTEARVSANTDVVANTAKTGITAQQANDITANNAKVSDVNHVASSTTDDLTEGTTNLYYTEARVSANTDVVANTAKTGITPAQAATIANTSGVNTGDQDITGIATNATAISTLQTEQTTQNTAIALNTAKVSDVNHVASSTTDDLTEGTTNLYYTEARVSANADVTANTAKTGITAQQASDITANTAKISVPTGGVAGDIIYNNGTDWVRLPKGTAGQVLAMNTAGTAPVWKTFGSAKRIGEFVYAKTGKALVDGYLAVTPGTVTDGAINYPLWAAQYPEFVSGNDIVFPADVAGMFLRNIAGNAGSEGTYQTGATALPNTSFTTNIAGNHSHTVYGNWASSIGGGGSDGVLYNNDGGARNESTSASGNHNHTIGGGDSETRPVNRAYQLYTIVDTY
ncbi:MAG: hypothetical protein L3J25_00445 [Flavobacteriaceae bacterium]|nr:hypothetical protein [Flavobacteriaceae bacterium]